MKNSFLLIGLHNFGTMLAMRFHELGQEVMAIDRHEDRVNAILPYVTDARIGDVTNKAFLQSLGIHHFDVCIVTIRNDFQSSLETTYLLKELGAKMVVARTDRDVQAKFLLRNGADEIINAEKQIVEWTVLRYGYNLVVDFGELDGENVMFELIIPRSLVCTSIRQIDDNKYDFSVIGVRKDGKLSFKTKADSVLEEGQSILVVGKRKDITKFFHL